MKIKGLRWWIIGLIMLITIINYLDRGTLNYMWVANIEYQLVDKIEDSRNENQAEFMKTENSYRLVSKKGETLVQKAAYVSFKNGGKTVVNRQGIAYDLGIVDSKASPVVASKQVKDLLGDITIFFMIAYGFSQLFSGKLYDKIGTRLGFLASVLIWGTADALTSLAQGKVTLTGFRKIGRAHV